MRPAIDNQRLLCQDCSRPLFRWFLSRIDWRRILKQMSTPGVPASSDASAWWALVMGAAASIEDAANCLRDSDAKKQADGAAKHYREAAQKLIAARGVKVPITAETVKQLSTETDRSLMQCKQALVAANGDLEVARVSLRTSNLAGAPGVPPSHGGEQP